MSGDKVRERVAKGLCPDCGKEAAPYRLCWDCRQKVRLNTALKRLVKEGQISRESEGRSFRYRAVPGVNKPVDERWGTPWIPPENDLRFRPRLNKKRVDVERTLVEIMRFIGRPCTIEEITAAWGKLREKRDAPLPNDLARIIVAEDRRAKRNAKRLKATPVTAIS